MNQLLDLLRSETNDLHERKILRLSQSNRKVKIILDDIIKCVLTLNK